MPSGPWLRHGRTGPFLSWGLSGPATLAAPPSLNCVTAQKRIQLLGGGKNAGGGDRMSRFSFPTASRLPQPGLEDKSPGGRAWEQGFLPHTSSYQILSYSGNSMGNESTQESGLAPERKVKLTKRKSLPILETMC